MLRGQNLTEQKYSLAHHFGENGFEWHWACSYKQVLQQGEAKVYLCVHDRYRSDPERSRELHAGLWVRTAPPNYPGSDFLILEGSDSEKFLQDLWENDVLPEFRKILKSSGLCYELQEIEKWRREL